MSKGAQNTALNTLIPHISCFLTAAQFPNCDKNLHSLQKFLLVPSKSLTLHTKYTHTYEAILTCARTSHDDVLSWDRVKAFSWEDQGQQSGGRRVTGNWLLDLTPKPCPPVLLSFHRAVSATWSGSCDCCADGN